MTLQNVEKIEGAADKNGLKNVTCKQGLTCLSTQLYAGAMLSNRNYLAARCWRIFTYDGGNIVAIFEQI